MNRISEALLFGAWMLGQTLAFAPNYNAAKMAAGRLFYLMDRKPRISSPDENANEFVSIFLSSYIKILWCYLSKNVILLIPNSIATMDRTCFSLQYLYSMAKYCVKCLYCLFRVLQAALNIQKWNFSTQQDLKYQSWEDWIYWYVLDRWWLLWAPVVVANQPVSSCYSDSMNPHWGLWYVFFICTWLWGWCET